MSSSGLLFYNKTERCGFVDDDTSSTAIKTEDSISTPCFQDQAGLEE